MSLIFVVADGIIFWFHYVNTISESLFFGLILASIVVWVGIAQYTGKQWNPGGTLPEKGSEK